MHLSAQTRYAADMSRVSAMLADEAFVEAKVEASGAVSHTVDVVGGHEGAFTVTTRRLMTTTGIPPQFRSLIGSTLEVRQIEAWEAPTPEGRRGTVVVEITGAPVRMSGTVRLEPRDGATELHVEGDLKASVPLFGAAVEEVMAGAVRQAMAAEERTGAEWLQR